METNELKQYGKIIKKRMWLISLIVLLACVACAMYTFYGVKPVYQASTKLIVNKADDAFLPDRPLNAGEITANILLINTYKEIIKSRAIMDSVAAQYPQLGLTAEQLIRRVGVSSINETQVMTLTVRDYSYEKAVAIVNAISTVFQASIPTIMKVDNVAILNEAKLTEHPIPVSSSPMLNLVIAFVVSLMGGVGLAFLLEYMDDTFRTERDVVKLLGVPAYGVIQNIKSKDLIAGRKRKENMQRVEETPYATVNQ